MYPEVEIEMTTWTIVGLSAGGVAVLTSAFLGGCATGSAVCRKKLKAMRSHGIDVDVALDDYGAAKAQLKAKLKGQKMASKKREERLDARPDFEA
jgi:hypothetical protein